MTDFIWIFMVFKLLPTPNPTQIEPIYPIFFDCGHVVYIKSRKSNRNHGSPVVYWFQVHDQDWKRHLWSCVWPGRATAVQISWLKWLLTSSNHTVSILYDCKSHILHLSWVPYRMNYREFSVGNQLIIPVKCRTISCSQWGTFSFSILCSAQVPRPITIRAVHQPRANALIWEPDRGCPAVIWRISW